jgi:AcrR family transcriptional regulator
MPRKRLTRQEQQARTRSRLLSAATKVFTCKGMEQASIDEVAGEAGYTKGAFYANFRSKDELYLAMLDERFAAHIAEVEKAFASDEEAPEQARHAAADYARMNRADPDEARLFIEFAIHALRDESFREELLTRFGTLRERLGEVYRRRFEAYGVEPPVPVDRVVRMVIAMTDGWATWRLLDPDGVDDELFETMIEIFTTGIGAQAGLLDANRTTAGPR